MQSELQNAPTSKGERRNAQNFEAVCLKKSPGRYDPWHNSTGFHAFCIANRARKESPSRSLLCPPVRQCILIRLALKENGCAHRGAMVGLPTFLARAHHCKAVPCTRLRTPHPTSRSHLLKSLSQEMTGLSPTSSHLPHLLLPLLPGGPQFANTRQVLPHRTTRSPCLRGRYEAGPLRSP